MTTYEFRQQRFYGGRRVSPQFESPEEAGDWFFRAGVEGWDDQLKLKRVDEWGVRTPTYPELSACHARAFGGFTR